MSKNIEKTYRVFRDVKATSKENAIDKTEKLVSDMSRAEDYFDWFRVQEDPFSDEEEGTILEIANIICSDPSIYDKVADELDITDKELRKLLNKISKITLR